ncbi:Serine protease inhibitor dipetalogastin [Gryllus bimaculatus]|nr:Serine protease inhibitor dipetalogastin [Gryllus bimaculatus]
MPGSGGLSAAAVCAQLSPDNPSTPCVALQPYLAPSDRRYWPPQDALLAPCRGEPCNGSQACLVNRNCAPGRPCLPYACAPGCRLGEVSQYVVPQGTYVRLLQGSGAKDCPKVCQCGASGGLERCQPLSCVYYDPCLLSDHQKIAHNAWFYLGCNICTCYSGEVTCSKRQCEEGAEAALEGQEVAFASLPCRCPPHHVPVCGRNGNTYPSSCLASRDPCAQVQCPQGQRCVPARKTCLSLQYRSCPQHQCVDVSSPCSSQAHDPVCDSDGEEHPNLCYLLRKGKALAYRGPCLEGCERAGVVCGADGNSYASECAAWAARAPVDYAGACVAVGFVSDAALPQCAAAGCAAAACPTDAAPPVARRGRGRRRGRGEAPCEGLTPPAPCCPSAPAPSACSQPTQQVDRILYSLKGGGMSALTVHAVLAALERQVQVAECSVRGYMTVELDLIALVVPAGRGGRPASPLQREACAREAEKLASLVQRTSPRVLSELSLSVLTTASVAHAPVTADAPALLRPTLALAAILFTTARALA